MTVCGHGNTPQQSSRSVWRGSHGVTTQPADPSGQAAMESPPNQQIRLERQPWSHHPARRSAWRGSHGVTTLPADPTGEAAMAYLPPPPPPRPQTPADPSGEAAIESSHPSGQQIRPGKAATKSHPREQIRHIPASRSVTP